MHILTWSLTPIEILCRGFEFLLTLAFKDFLWVKQYMIQHLKVGHSSDSRTTWYVHTPLSLILGKANTTQIVDTTI